MPEPFQTARSGGSRRRIFSIRSNNTIGGIAGQFDGRILGGLYRYRRHRGNKPPSDGCPHRWDHRMAGRRDHKKSGGKGKHHCPGSGGQRRHHRRSAERKRNCRKRSQSEHRRQCEQDIRLGCPRITSSAYEMETSDSQSNMNETNTDRVFAVTEEQTKEKTFYTETLGCERGGVEL